jgi:ascorbate-specific PTS system EIIC-type component UlaA
MEGLCYNDNITKKVVLLSSYNKPDSHNRHVQTKSLIFQKCSYSQATSYFQLSIWAVQLQRVTMIQYVHISGSVAFYLVRKNDTVSIVPKFSSEQSYAS